MRERTSVLPAHRGGQVPSAQVVVKDEIICKGVRCGTGINELQLQAPVKTTTAKSAFLKERGIRTRDSNPDRVYLLIRSCIHTQLTPENRQTLQSIRTQEITGSLSNGDAHTFSLLFLMILPQYYKRSRSRRRSASLHPHCARRLRSRTCMCTCFQMWSLSANLQRPLLAFWEV